MRVNRAVGDKAPIDRELRKKHVLKVFPDVGKQWGERGALKASRTAHEVLFGHDFRIRVVPFGFIQKVVHLFLGFLPPRLAVLEPRQHRVRIARKRTEQRLQGCSDLRVFLLVFSLFFRLHPVKLCLKPGEHLVDL